MTPLRQTHSLSLQRPTREALMRHRAPLPTSHSVSPTSILLFWGVVVLAAVLAHESGLLDVLVSVLG